MGQFSIIGGFGGLGGAFLGGFLYDGGAGFASGIVFNIAAAMMMFSSLIVYFSVRIRRVKRYDESDKSESPKKHSLSELPSSLRTGITVSSLNEDLLQFVRGTHQNHLPS
ncbi:MAG: hypothetical protein C4K49_05725 [Candidatus Thorarchaeota archaeon]|nr:MAG: hypothetical protein C4K49_05725 [Candidatus Thorarchaeota archaeon]